MLAFFLAGAFFSVEPLEPLVESVVEFEPLEPLEPLPLFLLGAAPGVAASPGEVLSLPSVTMPGFSPVLPLTSALALNEP